MSAHDDLQEGYAVALDTLSEEFLPGVTVTLLKPAGDEREYDTVLVVSSKRFFEFGKDRNDVTLEISDDSPALTAAMSDATHLQIDSDMYTIVRCDPVAPKGVDVTWKIFAALDPEKAQFKFLF